ncbi:hypothetical protein [Saccharopolyspora sp. NPDC050642]|uniref:hypothetical protein n=1 Tax=Saccharopolyspora sp. NPDC050642 TaxID=3157099 RepID=UPI0033C63D92
MVDPVEPGEVERYGQDIGNAADEVAAAAMPLTDSNSELGARMVRAIAAVREFADVLEDAGRGWSATE